MLGTARITITAPTKLRKHIVQHEHLTKYVIIGSLASFIDVVIFVILHDRFASSALVAHSVSVPTSIVFSFFFNSRHNFRTSDHVALRFGSFGAVCVLGYLTGLGVIWLAEGVGLGASAGKILSLPPVFLLQYVLNSRVTFRKAAA